MARSHRPKTRRSWTIIIVPPQATDATRTFRVHGRHLRAAVAVGLVGLFAYTGWSMVESMQVTATAQQLAEVHNLVITLSDSLQATQFRADSAFRLAAVTAHVAHGPTLITRHTREARMVGLNAAAAGVRLPVPGGTITSLFSASRWEPILHLFRPHEGLDIAAPEGTPIRAPADGRVIFVGHILGYGLVVKLDHGGGVTTLYAHCQKILVKKGDYVATGAEIATVGSTGLSTAPHVHFEVIVNGQHVDPLKYLIEPREMIPPPPAAAAAPITYAASDHEEP